MKLIHHLFLDLKDVMMWILFIIMILSGFISPWFWGIATMGVIFFIIWLWMGIHFWRADNKMFDRYLLIAKLRHEGFVKQMEELYNE